LYIPSEKTAMIIYCPGFKSGNTYFPSGDTTIFIVLYNPPCSAAIIVAPLFGNPDPSYAYQFVAPNPVL
jgi:hypothetical protein